MYYLRQLVKYCFVTVIYTNDDNFYCHLSRAEKIVQRGQDHRRSTSSLVMRDTLKIGVTCEIHG